MFPRTCLALLLLLLFSSLAWAAGTSYPINGYETVVVATGDFNGDGILDLAVGSDCDPSSYPRCLYGDISILLGNGDGTFQQAVVEDNPTAPRAFAVGDFNGDGVSDLAVAHTCSDETHCAAPLPGVNILRCVRTGQVRRWRARL